MPVGDCDCRLRRAAAGEYVTCNTGGNQDEGKTPWHSQPRTNGCRSTARGSGHKASGQCRSGSPIHARRDSPRNAQGRLPSRPLRTVQHLKRSTSPRPPQATSQSSETGLETGQRRERSSARRIRKTAPRRRHPIRSVREPHIGDRAAGDVDGHRGNPAVSAADRTNIAERTARTIGGNGRPGNDGAPRQDPGDGRRGERDGHTAHQPCTRADSRHRGLMRKRCELPTFPSLGPGEVTEVLCGGEDSRKNTSFLATEVG